MSVMNKKTKKLALAIGALALGATAIALAPPASAASFTITRLPDSITITRADVVTVNVPNATVCGAGTLTGTVPGRQDAISLKDSSGLNTTHCSGTSLMATVTPTGAKHRNGVAKFVLLRTDGSKAVLTLVVHVAK